MGRLESADEKVIREARELAEVLSSAVGRLSAFVMQLQTVTQDARDEDEERDD